MDQKAPAFVIPPAGSAPSPSAPVPAPSTASTTSSISSVLPPEPLTSGEPTGQKIAIASIVLLVLVVAFFFIRNMWALRLKKNRISESNAEASAWSLFVALTSLASALVLHFLLNQGIVVAGSALGLATICLILVFVFNRR